MSRVKTPGATLAAATILSPSPIPRSTRIACGLTLMPAPISPRLDAPSKISASKPNWASAAAVAKPARPPPTIAMLGAFITDDSQPTALDDRSLHQSQDGRRCLQLRKAERAALER